MTWTAGWNMPGYLPEVDPEEFDTYEEAVTYIQGELDRVIDDDEEFPTETQHQAYSAFRDLDPDHPRSWHVPETDYISNPVGGYVYWITEGKIS